MAIMRLLFVLMVSAFMFQTFVMAAVHYVSPTGNTSWTNSTTNSTPCSTQVAFTNAQAGDTVYFRGGTYMVPQRNSGSWLSGYYNPSNSGTEGHPIVFMAYPGEVPLFNGATGGSADRDGHGYYDFATIFGINDYTSDGSSHFKEHIVYDGFSLQADGGTGEARVSLARGDNAYTGQRGRGIVIKNCSFNGGTNINPPHSQGGTGDNREGLFISQLTGAVVSNCRLFDYKHTENNHNTSAIKTYHSDHITVENCEVYNSTIGVFYKSNMDDSKICYNYIHNCNGGVIAGGYGWWNDANDHSKGYYINESDNMSIFQNVFANDTGGSIGISNEDGTGSDNMVIYNNTFYSGNQKSASVGLSSGKGQSFYNNIMYGLRTDGDIGLMRWWARDNSASYGITVELEIVSSDHNQYGDLPSNFLIRVKRPDTLTVSFSTLAAWQASTVLTGGGHPGDGDLASDPQFVNTSGTMNRLADFALKSSSPCKGTGRNGVEDMGANIDLVGVKTGPATSINGHIKNDRKTFPRSAASSRCSIVLADRRSSLISGGQVFDIRGRRLRDDQVRPGGIVITAE